MTRQEANMAHDLQYRDRSDKSDKEAVHEPDALRKR